MGSTNNLPEWVVKEVVPHEDYSLSVSFADGSRKRVDMRPVIDEGKVFEPLNSLPMFMRAHVAGSSVEWNEQIDIAPEYLYEHGVAE